MRAPLALALMLAATSPALAQNAEAHARLAEDGVPLPQDLHQMRVIALTRDGGDLRFDAIPAAGGPPPDPAEAARFACTTPLVAATLAAGGHVEVELLGRPFARIDQCPPAQ